jgi:CTD small phosphatase-like protein 2
VKDLSLLLNGRNIKDIIIIDNKVESYSSNLENGIPIKSFYGDPNDKMLKSLKNYLMKLKDKYDVREQITKDFFFSDLEEKKRNWADFLNSRYLRDKTL